MDGSAAKEQIPEFLRMCRNASLNYTLAAKKYLARHPGADAGSLGAFLLAEYGITQTPSMPELPRLTAAAHLRELQTF